MDTKLTRIEPTSLIASEVAYVGSFIMGKNGSGENVRRDKDFFANRSTVLAPNDMHDELTAGVLEAIVRLYHRNEKPIIENIGHIMITEGLISPDTPGIAGEAEAWTALANLLDYYAVRGAKTMKDFRLRERAVRENWRNERLSGSQIEAFLDEARREATSTFDIAYALRQYADELIGETEMVAYTADWEKQKKILEEIPQRQRDLIGKPRFTFPSAWKLNQLIPVIRPGEKIVLSGGTGDGKSAMSMQFAEWSAITGKNVLVIHMEDREEVILMRQTVRWIGGTLEELEKGDPLGKMEQMIALREVWNERGGSIIYKYLAGHTVPLIVEQIKETAREFEAEGKHLDVVVMDYFQKADFDSQILRGGSYVNAANLGAEMLKITAEKLGLVMFVVSQETSDGNGGKHTAWTKALEQKPQVYISLTRNEIKRIDDEEFVRMTINGVPKRVPLAAVGDRSCWMQVHVKKVNQGRQGVVWLFFEGPRFRAFDPDFMVAVEEGQIGEFEVPVLTAADEAFFVKQESYLEKYRQGYRQLKNPDERKREKMKEDSDDEPPPTAKKPTYKQNTML
jgi:hypothetical protein